MMVCSKKIRIAFFVTSFRGGGAEKVFQQIINALAKRKYFDLFVFTIENEFDYKLSPNIFLKCFTNGHSRDNKLVKLKNSLIAFYKLYKHLRYIKPDVVISGATNRANIIALAVKVFTKDGYKSIICEHTNLREYYKNKSFIESSIMLFLIPLLYSHVDKIVTVSKGLALDLVQQYHIKAKKIEVIYNPININEIVRKRSEEIEPVFKKIFEYPVIINVGRLSRQKGQWHLIRAFRLVKEKLPETKLVFLGKGPLEVYLRKLAEEFGLKKDVYFLGFHKNPFKFIARAKVFVLSSLWESFGNVILESLACNTPVIATDCDFGPREILSTKSYKNRVWDKIEYENYGILVPPLEGKFYTSDEPLSRGEKLLAESIINLLSNKKVYSFYKEACKKAIKNFSFEKAIENYIEVIKNSLL